VLAAFDRKRVGQGPARVKVKEWLFDLHPEAFLSDEITIYFGTSWKPSSFTVTERSACSTFLWQRLLLYSAG
jgi:hypothetical protein